MPETYALYAWGNFIYEVGLDRIPEWLEPAVLSGERAVVHHSVAMSDEGPLLVDGSRTLFAVGSDWVEGRDFPPGTADWHVGYIRVRTDGTLAGAERFVAELEEQGAELYRFPEPGPNPVPIGAVHAVYEDPHGQWDAAVVKL